MPLHYLIALFIGLPIVELALILKLHGVAGFGPTFLLVIGTGIAGAFLVRRQGLSTLFEIQREMSTGNLPAPQLMDGIMILVAGAFLITPGLLTDAAGFTLLVPAARRLIRARLAKKLQERLNRGHTEFHSTTYRDIQ